MECPSSTSSTLPSPPEPDPATTPPRSPQPLPPPLSASDSLSLPRAVARARVFLTCPAERLEGEARELLAWIAGSLDTASATLWAVQTLHGDRGSLAYPVWHSHPGAQDLHPTTLPPELLSILRAGPLVELGRSGFPFQSASALQSGSALSLVCVPSWSGEALQGFLLLSGGAPSPPVTAQALPLLADVLISRLGKRPTTETPGWDSEQALRESVERLDEILLAAGVGVWSWRLSAEKSRFDERFLSLLGIGLDEWRGVIRDWYSLIHEDDRPHVNLQWDRHVEGETASYRAEYRIRSQDRGWRWILDIGKVKEWDEEGVPLLAIGAVIDRTELRTLEAQLHHSQKLEALGRLAGSVAHDFNNMVAVISGYAQMLSRSLPPESSQQPHVTAIQAAAGRASSIANELLSFSRPEPGQLQVLDLNEVIQGIAGMLRHLAGQGVEVELHLHKTPVRIVAGRSQLEQILVNLALNAGDAMSTEGGTLTIRTALAEVADFGLPHVLLTIEDTGSGMDEETLARLFEPFFTSKPPGKGTGLGLSRTPITIQEWGGTVEVWSQPGVGTTFDLQFPQAKS